MTIKVTGGEDHLVGFPNLIFHVSREPDWDHPDIYIPKCSQKDLYIFSIINIVANSVKPFEKVKWIHTRGKRESAQRPFVLIPLTGSAKGVTITKLQTPIGNQKWDKKTGPGLTFGVIFLQVFVSREFQWGSVI